MDVSIEEKHERRIRVTRHPVEEGADIADHSIVEPASLTIRAVISNTPARSRIDLSGTQTPRDFAPDRAEQAYEELVETMEERQPVAVFTTLREYDNMLIESISVPRNVELGNAVEVSIRLTEVITVSGETVEAPVTENPDGQQQVNRGSVPPKPLTEAEASTAAVKIADNVSEAVSGFIGTFLPFGGA